jgi:hypothetical protein
VLVSDPRGLAGTGALLFDLGNHPVVDFGRNGFLRLFTRR